MTRIEPDNRLLRSIYLDDVVTYLLANGWNRIEHANNRLLVFEGPDDDDGKPIKLILPRSTDYQDSYVRLAEAINLMAGVQDKPPDTLVNELAFNVENIRNRRQQNTNRITTEIAVLEHSLGRLQDDKAIIDLLFRTNAKDWHPTYSELSPVSIPEQTRLAHISFFSGIVAVISDSVLTGAISSRIGFPFWIGFLLSIPLTGVFQGAISTLFGYAEGGPVILNRIKRFILAPSFALSIIGLMTLMLIRMTTSTVSNNLSFIFTASLLITSLALPAMAAGLFAFWSVLSWSERAEKEYTYLKEKETELIVRREKLIGDLNSMSEATQLSIDRPLNRPLEISQEISS